VDRQPYSLSRLVAYFLKLGTIGFGGPVALVGYMNRDLVEGLGWYTAEEYQRGLAFSQLAPGPVATQLSMYLGYVRSGILGATLVGIAFVLPSFLIVLALGTLYVQYGTLAWISAAFYGAGAAIIAVIVKTTWKLARTTIKKDVLLWIIFVISFGLTVAMGGTTFLMFITGGVIGLLVSYFTKQNELNRTGLDSRLRGNDRLRSIALIPAIAALPPSILAIFWYFLKSGFIVFGSGLAIITFLRGGVVQEYHWLTDRQFLDAVAVAMLTPGPAVITVAFVGFLVRGVPGALAAALGVFLPIYLFVIFLAPLFEKFSHNSHVTAFVRGVTAVATGAIAGAVILLGKDAIVDIPTIAILLVSFLLIFRFKLPEILVIVAAGIVGVFLHGI
jgi:chromate transporter